MPEPTPDTYQEQTYAQFNTTTLEEPLMPVDNSSLERAIGRLEGKMEEVRQLVKDGAESRTKLQASQEQVGRDVHDLANRMGAVERTVAAMDPLVQEFARLKQRGLGMLAVIGFIWLAIGGLVLQGLGWLWTALLRVLGPAP